MRRRLIFLISIVAVLVLVNGVSAAKSTTWTNAGTGDSWCTSGNWTSGTPDSTDTARIDATSPNRGPIIDCLVDIAYIQGPNPTFDKTQVMDVNTSGTVKVREWDWRYGNGTATINIKGSPTILIGGDYWRGPDNGTGILNISGDPNIIVGGDVRGADEDGTFIINMSGGRLKVGDDLLWGDEGGGELNLSGGSIVTTGDLNLGGNEGSAPITVNMSGGSISVAGKFFCPANASRAGVVRVNLHAGVINCNAFVHGGEDENLPTYTDDWRLDIKQGTLKIKGDVRAAIDANVAAGQITAYDGDGRVNVKFVDGNTVVTGVAPDANTATKPKPADRTENVDPNVVLKPDAGNQCSRTATMCTSGPISWMSITVLVARSWATRTLTPLTPSTMTPAGLNLRRLTTGGLMQILRSEGY